MTRNPRPRQARGRSRVGERFTADVGPVAHGGHCVVRVPVDSSVEPVETRVVFVRHAIPGERVVVEITEGTEGDRFWRGDAVEVEVASPDRVAAPCLIAGPGGCGGCDFQHVTLPAQRALKTSVVREQLKRLAGLDLDVEVEAVPGDQDGLRWRTRVEYADTPDGRRGMRKHRSRDVIPVDDCLIAAEDALPSSVVEQVSTGSTTNVVETTYGAHEFSRAPDGFWQVHPGAPKVLVETVLDFLRPRPGESVMDLYAGVGLFARFLGDVGPEGSVIAVEGDRAACDHAVGNLLGLARAKVEAGPVARVLERLDSPPVDLVVLDPPREGAKRKVVEQIVSSAPRAVAYVACDPSALARDVAIFAEHGYQLERLRAFDLFPMTSHVECVALLVKSDSGLR